MSNPESRERLPRSARPTMKDVANRAGISTASVSRALSQPHLVSADLLRRIEIAARELDYTINAAARNLRRNDTGMVLVIVPDIGNPFFSKIVKGIEREARALAHSVLIGDTAEGAGDLESYAQQLSARRADGLILLNGRSPSFGGFSAGSGLTSKVRHEYPIVVVSERIHGSGLPTVGIDNVGAAEQAVSHLLKLGHRRIAHIAGPRGNILTVERYRGFRSALKAAGLRCDAELVVHGDFAIKSGRRAARVLLRRSLPPTAIFAASDEMAMGAIAEIKSAGLRVPGDISVVGFDDIEFAEIFDPALTTVHQPRSKMGECAMTLIGKGLRGDDISGENVVLETDFVIRDSTSRPKLDTSKNPRDLPPEKFSNRIGQGQ